MYKCKVLRVNDELTSMKTIVDKRIINIRRDNHFIVGKPIESTSDLLPDTRSRTICAYKVPCLEPLLALLGLDDCRHRILILLNPYKLMSKQHLGLVRILG